MWTVLETAIGLWFGLFPGAPLWASFLAYLLPCLGLANLALAAAHVEHWTRSKPARLSDRGLTQRLP